MPIYVNYAGVVVDSISERLGRRRLHLRRRRPGERGRLGDLAGQQPRRGLQAGHALGPHQGRVQPRAVARRGLGAADLGRGRGRGHRVRPPRDRGAPGRAQALGRRRRAGRDVRQPVPARRRLQVPDAARGEHGRRPSSRPGRRHGLGAADRPGRAVAAAQSAGRGPGHPVPQQARPPPRRRVRARQGRADPGRDQRQHRERHAGRASTGPSARRSCSTSRSRSTRPRAPRSSRSTSRSTR